MTHDSANDASKVRDITPDASTSPAQSSDSLRLSHTYRFADADMDLFFVCALGWGSGGGLEVGQAFYVASQIRDGDGDSWAKAFSAYGALQDAQADGLKKRGRLRAAGETRLKAFASYRSAWQFAPLGEVFNQLYAKHKTAFVAAMDELAFPVEYFDTTYKGVALPGVYLQNANAEAPVVLVIGGADTCFEDLFLGVGRKIFERGYSVALVDLPGQGNVQADGLYWEVEAEKPISAVVDSLVSRFGAKAGHIGLIGLSLGGYFVTRAAGHEPRFGAVVASTPFPKPGELFAVGLRAAAAQTKPAASSAARRNGETLMWKAGAKSPQEFGEITAAMIADPSLVTVPFLSIVGTGESPRFAEQAQTWHASIHSTQKALVELNDASGADGHCQVNNRLRLVQEACGWFDEIFAC